MVKWIWADGIMGIVVLIPFEQRYYSSNIMLSFVIVFIAAIVQGELFQPLPADFRNSPDVVWLGPDQFVLPWQFLRTTESRAYLNITCNLLYHRSMLGYYYRRPNL